MAYALGQLAMILAYRQAEASLLAPLTYAQLVTSTDLAWIIFAAVPDGATLGGIAIILASGAYTLHREQVRRRQLASAVATAAR